MSAATLTFAGQLTAALATERDPWHRTLSLISAVELMAEAFHGHDEHCMLLNFASELRGQLFENAQAVLDRNEDEREADRYGGLVDVLDLYHMRTREAA